MIGFKHTFSASEAKEHRDKLLKKVPDKYNPEIEQLYDWVTNIDLVHAIESNTTEQWEFCKRSMDAPPMLFIEKNISITEHGQRVMVSYPKATISTPSCRLCQETLASNIEDKVKHVVVSCTCGRMYCHSKCADEYLLKEPQCYICKNYFIYDSKNSALKATIVDLK
jgi:hypothetical protein